jgi:2-deoxy-D-gluconate 3-dehydrogenase
MILEKFRIDKQVAVVTGGTKGLGKAITQALAEAGADVAVVSRSPNPESEKVVGSLGHRYFHYAADLTQREQTQGVVPAILEEMGDIDILVNNAGIIRHSQASESSEADWDAAVEINLTAPFIISQAAGQVMLEKGRGKIINIASIFAFQGGFNVAYSSSKHGIAGLTKSLAFNWAGKGINVNAIAPGWFVTEFTDPVQKDSERVQFINARTPAGRWGNPEEDIAGAAVFLASPASDFLHGVVLPVDGGLLAC